MTKLAVAIALCLSVEIASADPEPGKIAQGGSPLFGVPESMSGGQFVCTLPEHTKVLVVAERPLVGPDGIEAIPGYYKKVNVIDGSCAGKTGWIVLEKLDASSHESRVD